ncbi:MAG TPA: FAD-dependent oxidoreductase [Myxococcales bacterium]|nr:FAD-dependent oxidoreductase [Myxococcales bacterium]
MVGIEELRALELFSTVPPDELQRVCREAADMQLAKGEYACHEGDAKALFVVLSGRIEVAKLFDGIERIIGARAPGQIFGEIPIVVGIPFQGSYRATEPSRVVRMEPRHFHALAACSPELSARISALARERLGGLQGFAAKPSQARAIVVGDRWDPACHDLRRFLTRNQITFEWLTPGSPDLAARWKDAPPAAADLPLLRCEDGSTLVRPAAREVARRLGLQTGPRSGEYDVVIVGGGPGGLAAAVYGASEGLRTIVIEREAPGGQAGTSSRIENYLGFPTGVSGDELARRALQQASRLGAEMVVTREVLAIDPAARTVTLDGGETLRTRTIILATGVSWRRLAIDGFDRLLGKGIYYGAARTDAAMTQGLDVHLIGAGNSAGQAALNFANHARSVTLVVRGDALEKSMSRYLIDQLRAKPNIAVALRSEVRAIHGDDHLQAVELLDRATGNSRRCECGGLFVFIGADAETAWLPPAIARDARGYVLTGENLVKARRWSESRDPYLLETSVPGIFACGDVRASPVKRVASAVGEGSMAIAFIHQYLQHV